MHALVHIREVDPLIFFRSSFVILLLFWQIKREKKNEEKTQRSEQNEIHDLAAMN